MTDYKDVALILLELPTMKAEGHSHLETMERSELPKYPVNCEQCGVEATRFTIDGAESKMICGVWPKCFRPTPPTATPDQIEREHCVRALVNVGRQFDSELEQDCEEFEVVIGLLLRERAAAAQAGYERGRAELQAAYQNLVDQEVGQAMDCAAHERAARAEGSDAGVRSWQSLCKCADLQTKYDTLAAAARKAREIAAGIPDLCGDTDDAFNALVDTLDAVLSETETPAPRETEGEGM